MEFFYLRDAKLASCGPVPVSVTSRSSIETDERTELVFGTAASFHLSYTVLKGNSGISKTKVTALWNFVPNSGLQKILLRQIHRRDVFSTKFEKGGRSERDKLNRRRSSRLTIPPSFDSRPLIYHSNRRALSTARFRRAGLLATADTSYNMVRPKNT